MKTSQWHGKKSLDFIEFRLLFCLTDMQKLKLYVLIQISKLWKIDYSYWNL